jgi:hypothetical protein
VTRCFRIRGCHSGSAKPASPSRAIQIVKNAPRSARYSSDANAWAVASAEGMPRGLRQELSPSCQRVGRAAEGSKAAVLKLGHPRSA